MVRLLRVQVPLTKGRRNGRRDLDAQMVNQSQTCRSYNGEMVLQTNSRNITDEHRTGGFTPGDEHTTGAYQGGLLVDCSFCPTQFCSGSVPKKTQGSTLIIY